MVTQWFSVIVGVAVGAIVAAVVSVATWALLNSTQIDDPSTVALLLGLGAGLPAAGYAAARTTLRAVFHGALAGLVMAGGVSLYASSSGGTASVPSLLALLGGGLALGGAGGWLADRRKHSPE